MSPTLKSLNIDQLSVAQRILLVEEIRESIAEEAGEAPLTEAQQQDLQRRLAAYGANPKAGSTWEEVKGVAEPAMSSLPFLITPEAEEDLADAKASYNRRRQGLGDDFILCVERAGPHLCVPQPAAEVYPGVRRVVVRRFPFGVFYRIDPDQIAVIAVYHSGEPQRLAGRA